MNKALFIEAVAKRLGGDHPSKTAALRAATEAVDAVLDTITRTVTEGGNVSITGFGTFEAVDRAARRARNPQTGDKVRVKATRVPRFRPGQGFKDLVSGAKKLPKTGPTVRKAPKGSITGGRSNMPAPAGSPRARREAAALRAEAKAKAVRAPRKAGAR
ncbi:nucleoid DNA-binding protein [Streptacidiphilus sp. MAP12-33]|uniref:HU family DNA-binding protein n=1 Tax=Streptacidiphilus sp. MAP12-33 TaxID=3156266 RepID=UPI003519D00C